MPINSPAVYRQERRSCPQSITTFLGTFLFDPYAEKVGGFLSSSTTRIHGGARFRHSGESEPRHLHLRQTDVEGPGPSRCIPRSRGQGSLDQTDETGLCHNRPAIPCKE